MQTTEVFGILPIPTTLIESADMLPSDATHPPKRYSYLARRQGTQFAVLTLHTDDEKALFSDFIAHSQVFNSSQPNWSLAAKLWNRDNRVDGITYFYKVCLKY